MLGKPLIGTRRTAENNAAASKRKGVVGNTGRNIPIMPSNTETKPMTLYMYFILQK